MTAQVQIRCAQGLGRLVELGREVARAGTWATHPRASEARLACWLDAQVMRAQLRGTCEVIDTRMQVDTTAPLVDARWRVYDDALAAHLDYLAAVERQLGASAPSQLTTFDVELPREAGAIPVAVAVAMVLVVGAWGWKWIEGAWDARLDEQRRMAAMSETTQLADAEQADRERALALGIKPEDIVPNPVRMQRVKDLGREAQIATANLTKREAPSSWVSDLLTPGLWIAVAAGAVLLVERR